MSCCGRQRELMRTQANAGRPSRLAGAATPEPPARPAARGNLLFEYVGSTALTVVGPSTGVKYRFDTPGARVAVDPSDGLALMRVPKLRRVA